MREVGEGVWAVCGLCLDFELYLWMIVLCGTQCQVTTQQQQQHFGWEKCGRGRTATADLLDVGEGELSGQSCPDPCGRHGW